MKKKERMAWIYIFLTVNVFSPESIIVLQLFQKTSESDKDYDMSVCRIYLSSAGYRSQKEIDISSRLKQLQNADPGGAGFIKVIYALVYVTWLTIGMNSNKIENYFDLQIV